MQFTDMAGTLVNRRLLKCRSLGIMLFAPMGLLIAFFLSHRQASQTVHHVIREFETADHVLLESAGPHRQKINRESEWFQTLLGAIRNHGRAEMSWESKWRQLARKQVMYGLSTRALGGEFTLVGSDGHRTSGQWGPTEYRHGSEQMRLNLTLQLPTGLARIFVYPSSKLPGYFEAE